MGDRAEGETGPILIARKLLPPTVRDQVVPRERLLERLRSGSGLRAQPGRMPGGLREDHVARGVARGRGGAEVRRVADGGRGRQRPVVFWCYVIEALRRAARPSASRCRGWPGRRPSLTWCCRAWSTSWTIRVRSRLILDDFHRLSGGAARESVAWFVDHAPPASSSCSRPGPSRPSGGRAARPRRAARAAGRRSAVHLRGGGRVPERAPRARPGARGDRCWSSGRRDGRPGSILRRCRCGGAADRHALIRRFGASSRPVVDFLVTEVLEAHDPPMQELMLRSSILERLSGPLVRCGNGAAGLGTRCSTSSPAPTCS